ncbi:MAG: hypothetical protein ABMA64_03745 [Myxococcota bacterium]
MNTNAESTHAGHAHSDADLRLPLAQDAADAVGEQIERLDRQVRALVHERPLATVAVAIGVGFVLGRLLRG